MNADSSKLPFDYLPEIRSAVGGTIVSDEPRVTVGDLIDEILKRTQQPKDAPRTTLGDVHEIDRAFENYEPPKMTDHTFQDFGAGYMAAKREYTREQATMRVSNGRGTTAGSTASSRLTDCNT